MKRLSSTSYKTKYPFNKVNLTESGHEVHFDDTPGSERIRIAHKSGTYDEISYDGRKVSFTVGNRQQYDKGGVTITVDENHDIKVSGHNRMIVGGGQHIEVAGDAAIAVGGDCLNVTLGNMHTAVGGDVYMGAKGDMALNIGGSMKMKVAGTTTMETDGDHVIKAANIRMN